MTPEEELAELQKKYALLEGDRKAYFETSQWTMKQNKETIGGLKKEYKELLADITERANAGVRSQKENEAASAAGGEELCRLRRFSEELKKRYDDLKQSAERKTRELENRLDAIRDLEHDSVDPSALDTDTTRRIRQLENRLDKALIKFNEARSISQTYDQFIKRLTTERVGFDGRIAALDRSLRLKEKDLDDLILMSHDAGASKEKAKAELVQVDASLAAARAKREKALRARRDLVREREEMNVEAARVRKQRDADEARRAEQNKKRAEAAKAANASAEERAKKERRGFLGSFESAFLKIKDATGVSDVDQVVMKFATQEDTNRNLKQLRKDGQARIEGLKREIEKSKSTLESLQFGGPVGPASRRAVDDLETALSATGMANERARARFESSKKLLVGVAAGAEHLVDKLDGIPFGAATPRVTEDAVVDVLTTCERKMLRALDLIKQKRGDGDGDPGSGSGSSLNGGGVFQAGFGGGFAGLGDTITPHNFRLELFPEHADESGDEEGSGDEEAGEESVPDRDFVKSRAETGADLGGGGKKAAAFSRGAPATFGSLKVKKERGSRATGSG